MATYRMPSERHSPKKRILDSLLFTTLWLLGFSLLERIAHGHWDNSVALAAGGIVCFFGGLLTTSVWPQQTPSFDLEIDEAGIRTSWDGKLIREVRRDRARYVGEHRGLWGRKLIVSEHESFGGRFLRHVTVPKRLLKEEQYELIKTQVFRWLQNSGR